MKGAVAVVGELVVWALSAFLLTEFLQMVWGMDAGPVPTFLTNWVASVVGLLLARELGKRIAGRDARSHAFTIAIVAGLISLTLAISPIGSSVTWASLGVIVACVVEWKTSNATFRQHQLATAPVSAATALPSGSLQTPKMNEQQSGVLLMFAGLSLQANEAPVDPAAIKAWLAEDAAFGAVDREVLWLFRTGYMTTSDGIGYNVTKAGWEALDGHLVEADPDAVDMLAAREEQPEALILMGEFQIKAESQRLALSLLERSRSGIAKRET